MECSTQRGVVTKVRNFPQRQELEVLVGQEIVKALNYPELTGPCQLHDQVFLNTTAQELKLGTGGWHYVFATLGREHTLGNQGGHIMKLRYTPLQGRVLSVEEELSPYHTTMGQAQDLKGLVVGVGSLHSMLAPLAWVLHSKLRPLRLVYLMSDGAALPIAFSKVVTELKRRKLLTTTITFGHAFGGDLEAVNIYSALLAAKHVAEADLAVVLMGPGVVGTNTTWGTTALEQGVFLNAVLQLGGIPVAIPRLSEADQRSRHFGLSHHTKTVLKSIVSSPVWLPLPQRLQNFSQTMGELTQLKHRIRWEATDEDFAILGQSGLPLTTMGRGLEEDPLFFHGVVATALAMVALI